GHRGGVRDLAFRGNSSVLATCCARGEVQFWDTDTGTALGGVQAHEREAVLAMRADGEVLATASWDGTLKFWQLTEEGEGPRKGPARIVARKLREKQAQNDVHSIAFSPDGKTVATGGLWALQLWDAATGQERVGRRVTASPVHCVVFRPD